MLYDFFNTLKRSAHAMTIKNLIIERLLSEKIVAIKSASYGHEKSLLFWEQAKKKLKQIDDHEEGNEVREEKEE